MEAIEFAGRIGLRNRIVLCIADVDQMPAGTGLGQC